MQPIHRATAQYTNTTRHVLRQKAGVIFLLRLHDASFRVVSEALDGIFEVFGQDENHPVFLSLRMMDKLVQAHSTLGSKV